MSDPAGKVVVDHRRRLWHRPGAGGGPGRRRRPARDIRRKHRRSARHRTASRGIRGRGAQQRSRCQCAPGRYGLRGIGRGTYGTVHQIYNNAGVEHHGRFEHCEVGDIERVMGVNFWGVVYGSKAFLPHLIASGDGHLINVSSLFGLLSVPGQSAYTASKFAMRGFTEALRQEMLGDRRPVEVTCVHPSGVKTAIARNATVGADADQATLAQFHDSKLAHLSADDAAQTIIKGVRKNKPRILIGREAKILDVLVRAAGPSYQRVAAAVTARALSKA